MTQPLSPDPPKDESIETQLAKYISLEFMKLGRSIHCKSHAGLNPGQSAFMETILSLTQDPTVGIKTSDISKKMGVAPPTIVPIIRNLEEAGYIQRNLSTKDRRVVLITITKAGLAAYEKALLEQRNHMAGLINYLTTEDSKKLLELLKKATAYFKQMEQNKS